MGGGGRGGRLAAVYNAGMDLKGSGGPAGFDSLRRETDLWLYEEDGAHWNSISAGIYILSWWTHGLALQINIHRHRILPSVK